MKYNKDPRETKTFKCRNCHQFKTIFKCDYDKRTRDNGREPDACSKPCAAAIRRADTVTRRELFQMYREQGAA